MEITQQKFEAPFGEITWVTLTNDKGASVTLSSLGAGIVKVVVPDKEGKLENVVIGYPDAAAYKADGPCAGKVPGRYANRIAKGVFEIDGKEYHLAINNGPNALHGGPTGFQNRIWEVEAKDNSVLFTYRSADGEEGYPGNLVATALYTWTDDDVLTLHLEAKTDAKTVVNLTNHAYFNLDGADSGSVLEHKLQLNASHFLPTDNTLIPTGELADVTGTPMDFRTAKKIGQDIKADFEPLKIAKGYDHCFAIDRKGNELEDCAVLYADRSGRKLTVKTTQPGVQIYTGNYLAGSPKNNSGRSYQDYEGVAIECQGFPDAPHHQNFPSQLLAPGEVYAQDIVFDFGTF